METFSTLNASSTPPATATADSYMEVSFTVGAGSIAAMSSTNDIQLEFNDSTYRGTQSEANDYSYTATDTPSNCAGSSYSVTCQTETITLYRNGVLVWGTEPGGAAESDGSSNSESGGGSDSSSGSGSDDGGPAGMSCGPLASRVHCGANQVCCAALATQVNACAAAGSCASNATLTCSSASDCPSSAPICCAMLAQVPDAQNDLPPKCTSTTLSASCASSCNDAPPSDATTCKFPPTGTGLVRLCNHDSDCASDTATTGGGCYNFDSGPISWCSTALEGLLGTHQP